MTRRCALPAACAAMLLALAPAAVAQSLGQLAKREAERRATVQAPGKVYTNDDLTPDFTTPVPPPDAAGAAVSAPDTAPAASSGAPAAVEAAADGGSAATDPVPQRPSDRTESYWRARAGQLRAGREAKTGEIQALRARLDALGATPDDPEAGVAGQAMARAISDLDALNQEWLRLEREARDAGVPDAWIR